MVDREERLEEARVALEATMNDYVDAFIVQDGDHKMSMPLLGHWTLIVTYDDALAPTLLASYRMSRKNQATHETAGLLYLALQELQRPYEED